MVSFSDAVKTCLTKKYFTISGRSTRAEYWWFQLFIWATTITLAMLAAFLGDIFTAIIGFFILITAIPNFCSGVRRLHDTNHSGWILVLSIIPYIGIIFGIYVFILDCTKSDVISNKYGPTPNE